MNFQIFLQARMGSTRLPNKALLKICGKTIIELIVERIKDISGVNKIVLATGDKSPNIKLVEEAKRLQINYSQGSEENVLHRFYCAGLKFNPDAIIRITGDCPLIDSEIINKGVKEFLKGGYDLVTNAHKRTYPDGMDFDIISWQALKRAWEKEKNKARTEKEFFDKSINPTSAIISNSQFIKKYIINDTNLSEIRLTLDYSEDFEVIKKIYENFYNNGSFFGINKIMNFLRANPNLLQLNKKYICLEY